MGIITGRLKRNALVAVFIAVTALLYSAVAFAQEGLSTLRGTVTDKSGAVVPGASIAAREVLTNVVARTVTTDSQGNYEMPGLKTGRYQVTASLTGFKKSVVDDVQLESNVVRRVDVTLEVGEVATEVAVSAAATVIQTESATVGADFNAAKRYWDLPIPGNAFSGTYAVLAVLPDVQREPGEWGSPRFAGQGGNQVHEGQDGIKEETLNSQTVNMESVAEVKAVYVNNSAEYARVGYFDTINKSGTNQFHGEASYYHRNSALGARGFFEDQKTKVIYHTFNLSGSGPIIKNKTFIYALWNAERVPSHSFYLSNVPTTQMRNGDFSQLLSLDSPITIVDPLNGQPFQGNIIPPNRLSSVAQKTQDRFFPLPNRGGSDALVNNLEWVHSYPQDQFHADVYSIRVDHKLSDKNSFYGRIQIYLPKYVLPGNYPTMGWTRTRSSQAWAFTDTHVFTPGLLNTFTFGGNRDGIQDDGNVDGHQPGAASAIVDLIGLQGVNQQGIKTPGGSPVFSIDGYSDIYVQPGGTFIANKNFTYADSMTWAFGKHILKYGGELRTYGDFNGQVDNSNYGQFTYNGSLSGNAYADFMLGLPHSSTRLNPLINRRHSQKELGMFITDTFKVTPKLTFDYGLRWDRFSSTTFEDGLMSNWDPKTGNLIVPQKAISKISPLYPKSINIVAGNPVPSPSLRNFVPRFGVAYRLNEKTVVRGGYGIFNEFLGQFARVQGGGPFAVSETYFNGITNGVPLFQMPNPFPSSLVSADVPSQNASGYPLHTSNGKIHQFNVTLERQVKDIGFRLSYIGSRNRGMNYGDDSLDINRPMPSLIPFTDSRRLLPQFVSTYYPKSNGRANYDSLSFNAERRVGWVTFDAHWTWANSMADYLNLDNPYSTNHWNRDLIARHRVVFNSVWELPFGKGRRFMNNASRAVDEVLGGWRLVWVTYLMTGQYFSPFFDNADPSNTNTFGGMPDRICNGNLPTGQRTVNHWFDTSCFVNPPAGRFGNSGVNILEGPGMHVHNATLLKRFQITEKLHFDLMALVGNIFNHPNFLAPAADISVPGGAGVINSVYGLFAGERAGPRMMEVRGRIEF
ncbi:MAG TPA: TonB-dependent receptor [Bryobacteraceae bacterium]|nr:TonB-dependent receptor [Bryobacteraceae bacterium]